MELAHLNHFKFLAEWDQEANLPTGHFGHEARAEALSTIAKLIHSKFISHEFEDALAEARVSMDLGILSPDEVCIVRETLKEFEKLKKIPASLIAETALVTGKAYDVWVNAHKNSDFKLFAPHLKRIIELARQEAECVGYSGSPYNALIDDHAPGMTTESADKMFKPLKEFLIPFIQKIQNSKVKINTDFLNARVSVEDQRKFVESLVVALGYNLKQGRLGVSQHPFSTSFHPTDCPITIRYVENNFVCEAIYSAVHEAGHGMYEQGLPVEFFGTPRGASMEHDVHEAMSRLWEMVVGHSLPFCKYLLPLLKFNFPQIFGDVYVNQFYTAINKVTPSLVRTESDEVTYNLHIILRYEIEKALFEGNLGVEDSPSVWNAKMKEYLGVQVPNDAKGILQDGHWASAAFGYFPAYTSGNLGSAQFYEAIKAVVPLKLQIAAGNFKDTNRWLHNNIYRHSKIYSSSELFQRATGEPLSEKYWISYVTDKYSEIYLL